MSAVHPNFDLFNNAVIRQAASQQRNKLNDAERVMEACLQKINLFTVDFSNISSNQAVDSHARFLIIQLEKLNEELNNRQELTQVFLNAHCPKINEAIELKKRIILKSAQGRNHALSEANGVLLTYAQRIDSFEVPPNKGQSKEEVESQRMALRARLVDIVRNKELQQALLLFGIIDYPPVSKSVNEKKQLIDQAAIEQLKALDDAARIVTIYVLKINSFLVTHNKGKNEHDIERQQNFLIHQLENTVKNKPDLAHAEHVLGFTECHPEIRRSLKYKIQEIRKEAERATISQREALAILEQINFSQHIRTIENMALTMEGKVENNDNYINAARFARKLHTKLLKEEERFLTSNKPSKTRVEEFKSNSLLAIEKALTVLEEHRGWKQVLADIASAILSILTLGIVNLATGRWRLFTPQTNSAIITKEVESAFQSISVGA